MKCPDCGVAPGETHQRGCDVARCVECGWQALTCEHHSREQQVWSGRWPGDDEVSEGLAADLNDLYDRALSGVLVWSQGESRFVDAQHHAAS